MFKFKELKNLKLHQKSLIEKIENIIHAVRASRTHTHTHTEMDKKILNAFFKLYTKHIFKYLLIH